MHRLQKATLDAVREALVGRPEPSNLLRCAIVRRALHVRTSGRGPIFRGGTRRRSATRRDTAEVPGGPRILTYHTWVSLLAMLLCASMDAIASDAVDSCSPAVARVVSIEGKVEIRRAGRDVWSVARFDQAVCAGDSVRVGGRSRAALRLTNATVIRLDQRSTLVLGDVDRSDESLLDLLLGRLHVLTRAPKRYRINTPFVNGNVEGTEFFVEATDAISRVGLIEGRLTVGNEFGRLSLEGGETAAARDGSAPAMEIAIRPRDAIQWTLYYPAVIDIPSGPVGDNAGAAESLEAAVARYRAGDSQEAIALLDAVPESERTAGFSMIRAQLLLTVGRLDDAQPEMDRVLAVQPDNAQALALESIAALVHNDKRRALEIAARAVRLEPGSPSTWIALAYAQQASFDMESAIGSARAAVARTPGSALALTRLAELLLSAGRSKDAIDAARRASAADPRAARAHTVLGFAHLTRIDLPAAEAAFNKAVELDQGAPLPRLGLGLSAIRRGDLADGRAQMEIAAVLDPGNSLLRSYLGKAYYDETRDKLAQTQYTLAKEFDPFDPTPWFYDSIRQRVANRPIDAQASLERSIALNGNREVFRSALLLDQDRAARGASLARTYTELGFERRGLLEATDSLQVDPASGASHQFLADSYASLPRREIARASELLSAQLLSPGNGVPVQPQSGEAFLNLYPSASIGDLGYGEYSRLLERDKPHLLVQATAGNERLRSDEVVVSGTSGRLSYSVGQFLYQTEGFRANDDLSHKIVDAFAQYALTPDLDVQVELRSRTTRLGDIAFNFDPTAFSSTDREIAEHQTGRAGFHATFSPASQLIGSLVVGRRTDLKNATDQIPEVDAYARDTGYQAELQHLFKAAEFTLTSGVGSYRIRSRLSTTFDFGPPGCPPFFPCQTDTPFRDRLDNAYVYANFRTASFGNWTLGTTFDVFKIGNFERDLLNPKLGLDLPLGESVRLRAAAIRTVKPVLLASQTVEPTQVAGFNQFFDDSDGTVSKQYSLGVDARIGARLAGGIESARRESSPVVFDSNFNGFTVGQRELTHSAYLYSTLGSDVVASAEYSYDAFRNEAQSGALGPIAVTTHSLPVSLRYFGPNGLFAEAKVTLVRQTLRSVLATGSSEDTSSFSLLDSTIGYRLSGHLGIVKLEGRNLLDRRFRYQDQSFLTSVPENPRYAPTRTVFVTLVVSF